jgi:hypothetical protein
LGNPSQLLGKVVGEFLELLERLGHFYELGAFHCGSVTLERRDFRSDFGKALV